jgi:hypothetical protein
MINSPGAYGCYSHVTAPIAERGGGRQQSVDDARSQNWTVAHRTARHRPSALSETQKSTAVDSLSHQEGAGRTRSRNDGTKSAVLQTGLQHHP